MLGALDVARRVGRPEVAAVAVGRQDVHGARHGRLGAPVAVVGRHGHGSHGRPVVGPPAGEHLLFAGRPPGDLDGSLVGLRPAGGEERLLQVAGRHFRQKFAEPRLGLRGPLGINARQQRGLLGDGRIHPVVAVPQVGENELGGQVQVLSALLVVDPAAFGLRRHEGIQSLLRRPWRQDILGLVLSDRLRIKPFLLNLVGHIHSPR